MSKCLFELDIIQGDSQKAQELRDAEAELSLLTATSSPGSSERPKVKCEIDPPGTSLEKEGIEAIQSTNPDSQGWQLWSRAALQSWARSGPIDLDSDGDSTGGLDGVPMLMWVTVFNFKQVDHCMNIVFSPFIF